MKLIIAIINHDDAHSVIQNLTKNGFQVTKLSTTGGFLMAGNVTIMIGVSEDRLQEVMSLISKYSKSRKQVMPTSAEYGAGMYPSVPFEVTVGGATVFILPVERFEKL